MTSQPLKMKHDNENINCQLWKSMMLIWNEKHAALGWLENDPFRHLLLKVWWSLFLCNFFCAVFDDRVYTTTPAVRHRDYQLFICQLLSTFISIKIFFKRILYSSASYRGIIKIKSTSTFISEWKKDIIHKAWFIPFLDHFNQHLV